MRRMRPVMMLPTLVTLGNLFSGFLAIAYLTDSLAFDATSTAAAAKRILLYEKSIFLIFLAMVFDALDGFVARLTKQASEFGAQVDSICDAVSFGAAPALLFKVVAEQHEHVVIPKVALVLAVIFLACGVLRLARFSLEADPDVDSHRFFEGLPIPAAAAVVASLVYANISLDPEHADSWIRRILPFVMPVVAFMMVTRIPYVHMGVLLASRRSLGTFAVLVFVVGFAIIFHQVALPLFCVGYLLSGPLIWLRQRSREGKTSPEGSPAENGS